MSIGSALNIFLSFFLNVDPGLILMIIPDRSICVKWMTGSLSRKEKEMLRGLSVAYFFLRLRMTRNNININAAMMNSTTMMGR